MNEVKALMEKLRVLCEQIYSEETNAEHIKGSTMEIRAQTRSIILENERLEEFVKMGPRY